MAARAISDTLTPPWDTEPTNTACIETYLRSPTTAAPAILSLKYMKLSEGSSAHVGDYLAKDALLVIATNYNQKPQSLRKPTAPRQLEKGKSLRCR